MYIYILSHLEQNNSTLLNTFFIHISTKYKKSFRTLIILHKNKYKYAIKINKRRI